VLVASGMSYQRYFAGAQFVHFLLGPATVALALPLARQVPRLRRSLVPLACALLAGCVTAIVSAVGGGGAAGGVAGAGATIAPKSATTPIAMAVSEHLGGMPALTAVLVIGTGIFGAVPPRVSCSMRCASSRTRRAAWRWAWPRTASAPRAPSRSVRKWALMPAWAWA
jgi:putative effector of murein hydrolase